MHAAFATIVVALLMATGLSVAGAYPEQPPPPVLCEQAGAVWYEPDGDCNNAGQVLPGDVVWVDAANYVYTTRLSTRWTRLLIVGDGSLSFCYRPHPRNSPDGLTGGHINLRRCAIGDLHASY